MGSGDELERLRRESQQLQKTVSQLELQVEELGFECKDLREICAAKSVSVGDALAARRHQRMFAKARRDHPLGSMRTSSEVLNVREISDANSSKHAEPQEIAYGREPDGRASSC